MAKIYFCMYGSFAWCVLPIPVNSSLVKLLLGLLGATEILILYCFRGRFSLVCSMDVAVLSHHILFLFCSICFIDIAA